MADKEHRKIKMKKVALGSDHAGFKMKEAIKNHLKSGGYEIVDTWLNTKFQGGRHQVRIDKIEPEKALN